MNISALSGKYIYLETDSDVADSIEICTEMRVGPPDRHYPCIVSFVRFKEGNRLLSKGGLSRHDGG